MDIYKQLSFATVVRSMEGDKQCLSSLEDIESRERSSDDIRHYLVKTNNRVLTEICQSLSPERGGSEWIFV